VPTGVANPLLAEVETAPETETVRVVEIISVPLEMPTAELADRPGDNALSFAWDAGLQSAASSRLLVPGATSEIISSLGRSGGSVRITAEITNISPDTKLHVAGRIVLDVAGTPGATQLRSEEIDVVLNPGGSTSAVFTFLVPTGDYSVATSFQSR
jgi:hypothetical protein